MSPRTFTDCQIIALLESLDVRSVFKDTATGEIKILLLEDAGQRQVTVVEFKARYTAGMKELEDTRREILENRFAVPLTAQVALGDSGGLKIAFLKNDHQLTGEEIAQKRLLLASVEKEIRHSRSVIAALNYLQVHAKTLLPRLLTLRPKRGAGKAAADGSRIPWTRGVSSAAMHCAAEIRRREVKGKTPIEICREFLSEFSIEGEPHYTPEQLCNNVLQIQVFSRVD